MKKEEKGAHIPWLKEHAELYASKMIMQPEQKVEEHRDPRLGQTDCRYAAESLRECEPAPENAVPDRRVGDHSIPGANCCAL